MEELSHLEHPAVRQFFEGPRGAAAAALHASAKPQEKAWKQK